MKLVGRKSIQLTEVNEAQRKEQIEKMPNKVKDQTLTSGKMVKDIEQ